ncbi:MAG: MarC family protein [Thermodesulfobacteriota bacterium]
MIQDIIKDFLILWAVVDPIGSIPVFLVATHGYSATAKRRIAGRATLTSAGILLFFIVVGQVLLEGLSIPLPSFQVAGGIVLFLFALSMVFAENKPDNAPEVTDGHDPAIFPIAVPNIAGPGSMMAVVVLTDNSRYAISEQALTAAVLLLILLITFILMLTAGAIQKVIGKSGTSVVSRVMGLILAAMAVEIVLSGIREYFHIGM